MRSDMNKLLCERPRGGWRLKTKRTHGRRFDWAPFDTLAVPGGSWCEHVNGSDTDPAILFIASDEPVLKAFALYQKHGKTEAGDTVRLG